MVATLGGDISSFSCPGGDPSTGAVVDTTSSLTPSIEDLLSSLASLALVDPYAGVIFSTRSNLPLRNLGWWNSPVPSSHRTKPQRASFLVNDVYWADLKLLGKTSVTKAFGRRMTNDFPLGIQLMMCEYSSSERTCISFRGKGMALLRPFRVYRAGTSIFLSQSFFGVASGLGKECGYGCKGNGRVTDGWPIEARAETVLISVRWSQYLAPLMVRSENSWGYWERKGPLKFILYSTSSPWASAKELWLRLHKGF